jgi:hypothetical protein
MNQNFTCFVCFEEKNFEKFCNGCHKGELCTDCYDSLSFPKTCPLCRFQEFPDDNGSETDEDQSDDGDYVGAFISHFNNHLREEFLRERNETFRAFRRLFAEDSDDEGSDDEDSDDDGEAFDSLFEPATPDSRNDGIEPEEDPYERYEYEMMNTPHVYGYY